MDHGISNNNKNKINDKTERTRVLGRKTKEETGNGNRMTVLRFQMEGWASDTPGLSSGDC